MKSKYKYKSLSEFKKDYPKEYRYLSKNNLISKFCDDMGWIYRDTKPFGYWTKERCLEEASKYKLKTEWRRCSGSSYYAAKQKGWLEECTAHMKK